MSVKNMKEILAHVMNMDKIQLNAMVEAINTRRRHLNDIQKMTFEVGQEVFINREEYPHICIIQKIMKKNIRVRDSYHKVEYDVSPNLLLSRDDYNTQRLAGVLYKDKSNEV